LRRDERVSKKLEKKNGKKRLDIFLSIGLHKTENMLEGDEVLRSYINEYNIYKAMI
jgi:hypothetical protein